MSKSDFQTGLLCALCVLCGYFLPLRRTAAASDLDEFKVKREAVFEFAEKPQISRAGDRVSIRFATKALCDATVAIEDAEGRIVRHLASGVLGPKAPEPFQKDSKAQTLVWDGKDDQGRYIDDKDRLTVRVSLGLAARFERTLFWFPTRRASRFPPLMAAAPEGVYVYDGGGSIDFLRLHSHDGHYLRTIYPFPADKVKDAKGLFWHTFPQDGRSLPIKSNFTQMTMLTSGTNSYKVTTYRPDLDAYRSVVGAGENEHYGMYGGAGAAMAVAGGRIALAYIFLNRLAADGTTGGLPLTGPKVSFPIVNRGEVERGSTIEVPPRSAALSPDGKTLYLSGFVFAHAIGRATADIVTSSNWDAFHAVTALDVERDEAPRVFAGSAKLGDYGSDDSHFKVPTSVATDRQGRVYVADYLNDRVQVFTPEGALVTSIRTPRPARVLVHQSTGDTYVFSWKVMTAFTEKAADRDPATPTLTHFGPLPEARQGEAPLAVRRLAVYPLPAGTLPDQFHARYGTTFFEYFAELDSWAAEPTFWIVQDWARSNVLTRRTLRDTNICLLRLTEGRLTVVRDFAKDLEAARVRGALHQHHRQRLYVDPTTGEVYLTEGSAFHGKSFKQAWVIDPGTGAFRVAQLPFDAEDMCFDLEGRAYLRTITLVARYDPATWREVPWDYGEARAVVHTSSSSDRRATAVVSGLALPANGGWHHGGMAVSPRGHLVVASNREVEFATRRDAPEADVAGAKPWTPRLYPGRSVEGRGGGVFFHLWDRHGQVLREDLLPGLADNSYGVGLDPDDNLYLLAAATRVLDGTLYFNDMTGTLMKVRPNAARLITTSDRAPVPLSPEGRPERPFDVRNAGQGQAWVEGAEWMYGGVGWCGKNLGVGCACFNCRFALDTFSRSFAPEMDRYSVAVLDSSGNLILRIGAYGNVDDGAPLAPAGGPPAPRAIGGDEVALFHGAYLATHTDRRLFIADQGNGRLLSVRLDYHAAERVPLKNVADERGKNEEKGTSIFAPFAPFAVGFPCFPLWPEG